KALEMKKPKSGPLDDGIKLASKSKYQIAGGINVSAALAEQLKKGGGAMVPGATDVKSATLAVAVGDDVQLEVAANFSDKDKAKSAADSLKGLLALAKSQPGMGNLPEPKQSGKTVSMSWKIDKALLDKAAPALKGMLGQMGGGGRRAGGGALSAGARAAQ